LAQTFAVGIGVNVLIGVAVLWRNRLTRRWVILAPVCMAGIVWLAGAIFSPVWKSAFSLGIWRSFEPPENRAFFRKLIESEKLIFHRDGAGATVTVVAQGEGGKQSLGLKVNGKADASTGGDVPTQRLLGHIPMFLRPHSQRALVVGLGSGMTCSAVARHPTIRQVDAVEISPDEPAALTAFVQQWGHLAVGTGLSSEAASIDAKPNAFALTDSVWATRRALR
jgi:hypothetical protein